MQQRVFTKTWDSQGFQLEIIIEENKTNYPKEVNNNFTHDTEIKHIWEHLIIAKANNVIVVNEKFENWNDVLTKVDSATASLDTYIFNAKAALQDSPTITHLKEKGFSIN